LVQVYKQEIPQVKLSGPESCQNVEVANWASFILSVRYSS